MLIYPEIQPYLLKLGPLQIRWYGVMYIIGFGLSYLLVRKQIKNNRIAMSKEETENLYLYLMIGLIAGGRIGYVIFYNLFYYLNNLPEIFAIWRGGMSFHGGLIGSIVAGILFCRQRGKDFFALVDIIIVTVPLGLGLGRIGNFINAELYGRVTTMPWGMVFPGGGELPRHPSQIYEFLLEGLLLFIILWFTKEKVKVKGGMLALFLVLYGLFRSIVEFFREPDVQIGFIMGFVTMGQILSFSMILTGLLVFIVMRRKQVI